MPLEHIKYNLDHGFPDHWGDRKQEMAIIQNVCKDEQFDLVVNAVWGFLECRHPVTNELNSKFEITKDLVLNYGVRKMLFFNFVDPLYEQSTWYKVLDFCKQKIGEDNIRTMGHIDSNKFKQDQDVPFWAIHSGKKFRTYADDEVAPVVLENTFLCYNRKPTFHRKWLYEQFKKNDLLNKGIFTLGKEVPGKEYDIPNDNSTLGPLDVWNSSFLIIVTETDHNMHTAVPFLSEKIWKPLIGMRPFICLGDKGTIKSLKEAGFHTFNEFFGSPKEDLTVDDVVNLVKRYKGNPTKDYNLLKDKLIHNRKRFFEYAREQSELLGV